jgi:phosphatase NudJ
MTCINKNAIPDNRPPWTPRWKPDVTVAAIIEREGRFLLVEEHTPRRAAAQQPGRPSRPRRDARAGLRARGAGGNRLHLLAHRAARRLPLAHRCANARARTSPTCAWPSAARSAPTTPSAALDDGIVRTLWLTPDEVRASADRHRSPLVLRCINKELWSA